MSGRRWAFGLLGLVLANACGDGSTSERLGLRQQPSVVSEWTATTVSLPSLGLAWPELAPKPAVDWDGTQYVVMWADGGLGTERVWVARLSKDLSPIDTPALNADVYVPDPGAGPIVSPSVTCRATGTCLLSWSGGLGPSTPAFQQARLWTTNQALGPVITLPEISWADRSSIAAGENGFLMVWMKHAIDPFKCSVESVFVANDGTTQAKTLAPATTSQCVIPRAIWNGTHYVVTWGAPAGTLVQSYDAALQPLGNITLAMTASQLASDESGGLGVMGIVNQGLSFQKLSASLEPGLLEPGTLACQRAAIVRRPGGFAEYCVNDAFQLSQYFRSDSNGAWTQSNPNLTISSQGLAVSGGLGHGLLVAATPSLDAYPLTTTGALSGPAAPGALLAASASSPTLAASSSGWVVSWNQDTTTKLDGARYARISASGAPLDDEPRLLYPGTSKGAYSLALSSEAMMTENFDGLVLFKGEARTTMPWPVANPGHTGLLGGPGGFLESYQTDTGSGYGAITHRTFLVRRNAEGEALDDPPLETCNAVSVGEGGEVCYGKKLYSSGQNYLVARELSTWLLVKPGAAPLPITVPADDYGVQVFGNDGSFHLAKGTVDAQTAVISPDGVLSAWAPVTLPAGAVRPAFFSFGAQEAVMYRTVTDGHVDETWIAELDGTVAGPPSLLPVARDDQSVLIASAIPGAFVRVHSEAGKLVAQYFKQTVALGAACLVSTQCGENACVDGTCQAKEDPGLGGSGNLGGASGAGDVVYPAGGVNGGGTASATGGNEAGGISGHVGGADGAETEGGEVGAPPAGEPDASGCQCRGPSRPPGSSGWWLSALVGVLAVQRRARKRAR